MPRALKVCATSGCPELTSRGRCPGCVAKAEAQRGSRQQRGYDREHERIRAALLRRHQPGAPCPVCQLPMLPGQKLDAGHSVDLRANPAARADRLEHASCNRGWRARPEQPHAE